MSFNDWALRRAINQEKKVTDDYNMACSENLRYEVNRVRAKDGLPPLPTYTPPADNGERNRKSDAKVSDPVNKRKHSHYFRDVSKLTDLDVYRICELFVDDRSGATQHAVKKLLLPGLRGAKDRAKDLQEAVDTLNRKLEMMREDAQ